MTKVNAFLVAMAMAMACALSAARGESVAHKYAQFLPAGGFETEGGWTMTLEDGAKGEMARDAAVFRSGGHSLRLTKTNGEGFVRLVTTESIAVKAGTQYTFRGWFHGDDVPFGALLLFRVSEHPTDSRLPYDDIDRSAGYSSQSLVVNTPRGHWWKRVIRYQPAEDKQVYLHVVLWGNPATVWLDDLEFTDKPWTRVSNGTGTDPVFTEDEVRARLAQAPNSTLRIARDSERWWFELNGEITPPELYKALPYRLYERGYLHQYFGEAGVPIQTVTLNFSHVRAEQKDSDPIWRGPGEYDLDLIEEVLLQALRRNPDAKLMLDLIFQNAYTTWASEHPDDIWLNEEGEKGYGYWGNLEGWTSDLAATEKADARKRKLWHYFSYHSDAWLDACSQAATDVLRKIMQTPFGKCVVGFQISGGHDGQFMYHGQDWSPVALKAWRDWLEVKYGTIAGLNAAWKTEHIAFTEINPPVASKNLEGGAPILGPGLVPDYWLFREERTWQIKDELAAAAKAAAGKPTVATAYGSCQNLYQVDMLARFANLDATAMAGYYPMRLPGYPLGFKPSASVKRAGKGTILELDTRTFASARQRDEVYEMWISQAWTPRDWMSVHRKMVGAALANGEGWWYYSMNYYFDDPFVMGEIAKVRQTAEETLQRHVRPFRPDVCVVDGGANAYYPSANFDLSRETSNYPVFRGMLETSGVPYDQHTLEAVLEDVALQEYRVYVFPRQFLVTSAQRRLIKETLQSSGRTLVWMYGSGYLDEHGPNLDAMSDLVGMRVATEGERGRATSLLIADASPWTEGCLPRQGAGEISMAAMALQGRSSFVSRAQEFRVDDPEATALARYRDSGEVSMAVREHQEWTDIYVAPVNGMNNDLVHRIAATAGAFVASEPGQSIQMNGNFASIHGLRSGRMTFRLPPGATRVLDPDSRRVLADGVETYEFWIDAGDTVWFWFE